MRRCGIAGRQLRALHSRWRSCSGGLPSQCRALSRNPQGTPCWVFGRVSAELGSGARSLAQGGSMQHATAGAGRRTHLARPSEWTASGLARSVRRCQAWSTCRPIPVLLITGSKVYGVREGRWRTKSSCLLLHNVGWVAVALWLGSPAREKSSDETRSVNAVQRFCWIPCAGAVAVAEDRAPNPSCASVPRFSRCYTRFREADLDLGPRPQSPLALRGRHDQPPGREAVLSAVPLECTPGCRSAQALSPDLSQAKPGPGACRSENTARRPVPLTISAA